MGKRGEFWVAVQAVLLLLLFIAPPIGGLWPYAEVFRWTGWACIAVGTMALGWSAWNLGRSLTPFPRPVDDGQLVTTGAYRFVRHPIYSGVLVIALGIALLTMSPLRLVMAAVLFVFFNLKARREERWLEEKYPDYAAYRKRVKRLIPWIY